MSSDRSVKEKILQHGLFVKAASACVGAIATNLVATPLDVVKVRLQAAAGPGGNGQSGGHLACASCGHFKHTNGGILERIMCSLHRRNITSPSSLWKHYFDKPVETLSTPDSGSSVLRSKNGTTSTKPAQCTLCGHLKHSHSAGLLERCTPQNLHHKDHNHSHTRPRQMGFFSRADSLTLGRVGPKNASAAIATTVGSDMGTLQAMRTIVRNDGFWSLWDGLRPTLVMAVPNTMLYMVMYDEMAHTVLPRELGWSEQESAIVAGGVSRAIAGTIVAPLELVRTQMQASTTIAQFGMIGKLHANVKDNGFLSLWKGLVPTLWRDVPFSVVYWYGYEFLRRNIRERMDSRGSLGMLADDVTKNSRNALGGNGGLSRSEERLPLRRFPSTDLASPHDLSPDPQLSSLDLLILSFASGAGAGGFAAFITTPFDVVKTHRQVDAVAESTVSADAAAGSVVSRAGSLRSASTSEIMLNIARSEGLSGWFTGVGPRVVKVAPACAIMISTYEIGKSIFGHIDDDEV